MHKYGNFSAAAWSRKIIANAEGLDVNVNPVKASSVETHVAEPMPMEIDKSFKTATWVENILARVGVVEIPEQ